MKNIEEDRSVTIINGEHAEKSRFTELTPVAKRFYEAAIRAELDNTDGPKEPKAAKLIRSRIRESCRFFCALNHRQ